MFAVKRIIPCKLQDTFTSLCRFLFCKIGSILHEWSVRVVENETAVLKQEVDKVMSSGKL